MDDFQQKFLEEANDLIQHLEEVLLKLDKSTDNPEYVEEVFRVMHSLKGGGAMFGYERISEFTHNLENIYELVRAGELKLTRELLDLTLESADHIKQLLDKANEDREDVQDKHADLTAQILKLLKQAGKDLKASFGGQNEELGNKESTYYISFDPHASILKNGTNPLYLIDELGSLGKMRVSLHYENIPELNLLQSKNCYLSWEIFLVTSFSINEIQDVFIFVEEESQIEIRPLQQADLLQNETFVALLENAKAKQQGFSQEVLNQYKPKEDTPEAPKAEDEPTDTDQEATDKASQAPQNKKEALISSIRVSSEKVDKLMNLVSELVTTQASLSLLAEEDHNHKLVQISENVESLTRQLRDIAFSISLIPIESLVTRFHRLVRDLSKEFGKTINFATEGTDTELDKSLIQNLTEPIMHLLRNSIDHAIEDEEERTKQGKSPEGHIRLRAFYSGTNVNIQIIDDGRGIDPQAIKQKAIDKEMIKPGEQLTEKQVFDLIFRSGFSTAQKITGVSGRGVGMDVVKRKINEVRGDVDVSSEIGVGTTVTISLPLTLSIIDGLLVTLADTRFVIPLSAVEKIYEASLEKIEKAFNNVIVLDGKQIPFYYLREEFEYKNDPPAQQQVVVVKYQQKRIGMAVDEVVGEYQAVIKALGRHYKNQEIISGATILGDGTVALVLDTNKIIKEFSLHNQTKEELI